MNKIKKLWMENRVLFVLFIIVFICACIILGVVFKYFFGATKSNYGERLDGIEAVEITDTMKNDFLVAIKDDELVDNATIDVRGKIVYIYLTFNEGSSLVEAQSKALEALQTFEQNYLDFYDFHFTLKSEATENSEGFLIMGAKNVNGSGLVWNNNTPVADEDSE